MAGLQVPARLPGRVSSTTSPLACVLAAALGAGLPAVWPTAALLCTRRHIPRVQGAATQGPRQLDRLRAAAHAAAAALCHEGQGSPEKATQCPTACSPTFLECTRCQLGDRLRVDGTLMGLEEHRHSLIPHYKRGRFSLLVDAGEFKETAGCLGRQYLMHSAADR